MAPLHLHQLGVGQRCGFAREGRVVVHVDRVVGIASHHVAVLHIDRRHTIDGGSDDARVVKTYLACPRGYVAVPVNLADAHAEVPFAHGSRGIACLLEHAGHGELLG